MVSFWTIFVKFNFHHRKRFSRKVLARIEWNLIWEMLTLCEFLSVVGFCSVVIMVTVCLLNCFFLVFFSLMFSFLAIIVYSNLQHRTKGIEKRITQFWIRSSGFKLRDANHYTIQPTLVQDMLTLCEVPSLVSFCSLFVVITVCLLIGFFLFFVESFLFQPIMSNLKYNIERKIMKKTLYLRFNCDHRIQRPRC